MVSLFVVFLAIQFYFESPRYIYKIGKADEARAVLETCHLDGSTVEIERKMIEQYASKPCLYVTVTPVCSLPTLFWTPVVGSCLAWARKLFKSLPASTYLQATEMVTLARYSADKEALLASGNTLVGMVRLAVTMLLTDRVGRRKLMKWIKL
jgi:hypothetical protein